MRATWAAMKTRPTTFQTEATAPNLNVAQVALLMWKFQARRVRALA